MVVTMATHELQGWRVIGWVAPAPGHGPERPASSAGFERSLPERWGRTGLAGLGAVPRSLQSRAAHGRSRFLKALAEAGALRQISAGSHDRQFAATQLFDLLADHEGLIARGERP